MYMSEAKHIHVTRICRKEFPPLPPPLPVAVPDAMTSRVASYQNSSLQSQA